MYGDQGDDGAEQKCPLDSGFFSEAKARKANRDASNESPKGKAGPQPGSQHKRMMKKPRMPVVELLILCGIVSACVAFLMYYTHEESPATRMFTEEQLSLFTGERNSPMYLAILGEVYDVTKSKDKYGKDGYHFFLGKDASRSYVTGNFKGDLTDDIQGLTDEQCAALVRWRSFFRENPDYKLKGRVLGRFWNVHRKKRIALNKVEEKAARAKTQDNAKEADAKLVACNVRGNTAGGTVWCDDGLKPRLVIREPSAAGGETTQRCACFDSIGWSDMRKVYPGCKPESSECHTEAATAQSHQHHHHHHHHHCHHHQQQQQEVQPGNHQRGQQLDLDKQQQQTEVEGSSSSRHNDERREL